MSDLSKLEKEKELILFNPVVSDNVASENVQVIKIKSDAENIPVNTEKTTNRCENILEPNQSAEYDFVGKQQLSGIEINNSIESNEEFSSVYAAADPESSSSTPAPANTNESINILKRILQKTVYALYDWSPLLVLTMFGTVTWLVFGSGLKYVYNKTEKYNKIQEIKLAELKNSQKEKLAHHIKWQDEKLADNTKWQDEKLADNIKWQDQKFANNFKRQDEKFADYIKRQEQKHAEVVLRLKKYNENFVLANSLKITEHLALVDGKYAELSLLTKENDAKHERKITEIVARLEKQIEQSIAKTETGLKEAKLWELHQTLLNQLIEKLQLLLNEQKHVGSKSDNTIYTEQEMALRAAMERHLERTIKTLPEDFPVQFTQFQKSIERFKLSLNNEAINLNNSKSKEETERVITNLTNETSCFAKDYFEMVEPTMRFMRPLLRKLRLK